MTGRNSAMMATHTTAMVAAPLASLSPVGHAKAGAHLRRIAAQTYAVMERLSKDSPLLTVTMVTAKMEMAALQLVRLKILGPVQEGTYHIQINALKPAVTD